MKSFLLKLSLTVFLLAPLTASAQATFDLNKNTPVVQALQNDLQKEDLLGPCGNAQKDEGEDCDLGAKNGDPCSSCTKDCHYQWVPADCTDESAPTVVILDPNHLTLNHFGSVQLVGHLLGANNDSNVNHVTKAPPGVGTAVIPSPAGEPVVEPSTPTPVSEPTTAEVPSEANGGCSFTAAGNATASFGHALIFSLSLLPLVARWRRS